MLTTILAAGTAAAKGGNPYGLIPALREGGLISQTVFGLLVLMLFVSLYIFFTKIFEQQKIINQAKRVRASFWSANSLREGAAKLEKNSAYRQIVDDGLEAQEQYKELTDPVDVVPGLRDDRVVLGMAEVGDLFLQVRARGRRRQSARDRRRSRPAVRTFEGTGEDIQLITHGP